jgi:HTH-type transcriptional regulator/antitoxin HigA
VEGVRIVVEMTAQALAGDAGDEYLMLVQAFPLVHIHNDAHLDAAMVIIDSLLDKPVRSVAEEAYLGALTDLVEAYEREHVLIPPRTGLDALRFLMATNDLKQVDLVPVLGRKSIVSEVLSGRRPLALSHIKKLATYFGVSADTFID